MPNKNAAKPRINKSQWIREQPPTMAAKDVLAKAAKSGIKLTVAQIYTARSSAKKAKVGKGKAGRPRGSRNVSRKPRHVGAGDDLAFRRLVLSIGLPQAEAYLNELKRSVGL